MSEPRVTIAIASINTLWATELCLRSLAAHDAGASYRLVVGDCGSTDGSLPMLTRRLKAGLIDKLEVAAGGRKHAEWVDYWLATCGTKYLLMLDSDVEIRADGWLGDMVALAEDLGAAMCPASILPENLDYRHPVSGESMRLGERQTMHCVLLDVKKLAAQGRPFRSADAPDPLGGTPIHYDVGGWAMAGVRDKVVAMPDGWESRVLTHFRALSWAKEMTGERRKHYFRTQPLVFGRLLFYRVAGAQGGKALALVASLKQRLALDKAN